METLLSSPNCTDWVEISKMLLGPLPEGFEFVPKHKSNSYPTPAPAPTAAASEDLKVSASDDPAAAVAVGEEWSGEVE